MSYNKEPLSYVDNIKFFIYGNNQILNNSVFDKQTKGLTSSDIYDNKLPKEGGLIDKRMGTTNNSYLCTTCNLNSTLCPGHFGHIKLRIPMFNIKYLSYLRNVVNSVCQICSKLRLTEEKRKELKKQIEGKSNEMKYEITREACSKNSKCYACGGELFKFSIYSNKSDVKLCFVAERKSGTDDKSKIEYNQEDIYNILSRISDEDAMMLGFNPSVNKPTDLMITVFPVPPVCIRPSIRIDGTNTTSEDDLTRTLANIFKQNENLIKEINAGSTANKYAYMAALQQAVATFIDNNSQYAPSSEIKKKQTKSITERVKAKEGRIQGNLMGKRVNFCGRSVLTGDTSINVNEIGIPIHMAKILTIAEYATPENIQRLRKAIKNGKHIYPGANYIKHKYNNYRTTTDIEFSKDVDIEVGDIVERHIVDGDVVLFNRQPSLHKYSMMAHYAKIIDNKDLASLRLNIGTTDPYNADYDGDEMNIFIPRTEQSRIELKEIAAVHKLMINEQKSSMTIGCKGDNITGPYLLSITDVKFSKYTVMNFLATTEPPIDKLDEYRNINKKEYYTGKEILSFIIPKKVNINGVITIENGVIIDGFFNKSMLGSGEASSLIRLILDLYNAEEARKFFDNIQRLSIKYLEYRGFTSSIADISYSDNIQKKIDDMIKLCLLKVNVEVSETENDPSIESAKSLETIITSYEDNVRDTIGKLISDNFKPNSSLNIFMKSGSASKVSATNICKACSLIGQDKQSNTDTRFVKKDMRRTLPYFNRDLDTAFERGFVTKGFIQGMDYPSFIFNAISSRESLIKNNLKTADSGYFEKKVIKSLEDSKIQNDRTVRNTNNTVIQFSYADNGLSADRQYLYRVSFLMKSNDEIKQMGKGNKKYIDRVNELKKRLLSTRVDVKINIVDLKNLYRFYTCINVDKIKSMMSHSKKKDLSVDYLLDKLADFDDHLNILLNGSDKSKKRRFKDNEDLKVSTIAVLYDVLNPKAVIDEYQVDKETLDTIMQTIIRDSKFNLVDVGKSVGVIAAHSMSENITQANLRSHHNVGQKSAATSGLARLKELVGMTKLIKSPSMTIKFKDEFATNEKYVKQIESFIDQTNLSKLRTEMKLYYDPNKMFEKDDKIVNSFSKAKSKCNWLVRINLNKEELMSKGITIENILTQITDNLQTKYYKDNKINKQVYDSIIDFECKGSNDYIENPTIHIRLMLVKYSMNVVQLLLDSVLDNIKINGIKDIESCEMNTNTRYKYHYDAKLNDIVKEEELVITTSGINIDDVRLIKGVNGEKTLINDMNMIYALYGIEALRYALLDEFTKETNDAVKYNHIGLLIDYMTSRGYPISIDRNGLGKSGASLTGVIAFEESIDVLVNASVFEKEDNIDGISGRLMTGRAIKAGTGFNEIILDTNMIVNSENEFQVKETKESKFNDLIDELIDDEDLFIPTD